MTVKRTLPSKRKREFTARCEAFPHMRTEPAGATHLSVYVGKKRIAYYLEDHHGDGRLALHVKSTHAAAREYVDWQPDVFHVPAYLGNKGWLGMWLDTARVDWDQLDELLEAAYRSVATRKQLADLDALYD